MFNINWRKSVFGQSQLGANIFLLCLILEPELQALENRNLREKWDGREIKKSFLSLRIETKSNF